MQFWKRAGFLASIASAAVFTTMCGKDDASAKAPLSTLHTAAYVGSGSVWNWSLAAAGTFTATKKTNASDTTPVLTLNGTYTSLSTGFYKFTVPTGGATGTDAASLTLPATAFGYGIPNVVLMVKPVGSANSELLVMPVTTTTCPTANVEFNWVEANTSDYGAGEDLKLKDLWGNAVIPAAGGAITGKKFIMDGTLATLGAGTAGACSNGSFSIGSNGGFINLTAGGVGIVKPDGASSANDIIALPRDTAVTTDTIRSKEFVGLVFEESSGTKPISITFPASGDGTYTFINDVETGATGESGPLAILEAGTGEKAGFLKLRANAATNTNQPTMWAATVSNIGGSNRTFWFASGADVPTAGGAATGSFSVIAIQK